MVEASLASPFDFFNDIINLAILKCLNLLLKFVLLLPHGLWLTTVIVLVTSLLASEAELSALEVVVVASAAFPATWWEDELLLQLFCYLFNWFFILKDRNLCLVKRSDSTCKLCHFSQFRFLL